MKDWRDLFYFSKSERSQLPEQIPFPSPSRKIPSGVFLVPFRSHVLHIRKNGGFRSLLFPRPNAPEPRSFQPGHRWN